MVNLLWGEDGEVNIRLAVHNLFIIQFLNFALRDRVLESGPWHKQNKLFIVQKWEPRMRSLDFNMAKLPIRVHLGNIPLELFSHKGISYIISVLGNPVYMIDLLLLNSAGLCKGLCWNKCSCGDAKEYRCGDEEWSYSICECYYPMNACEMFTLPYI